MKNAKLFAFILFAFLSAVIFAQTVNASSMQSTVARSVNSQNQRSQTHSTIKVDVFFDEQKERKSKKPTKTTGKPIDPSIKKDEEEIEEEQDLSLLLVLFGAVVLLGLFTVFITNIG